MRTSTAREVVGVFVPLDPARTDTRAANMGWITDANGCDIWQGAKNDRGYGRIWDGGRNCYVTRVRYEREVGPIPEGADLDHFVCDNGPGGCCNPFHCRPASRRENTLRGDGIAAAYAARTQCPDGHPLSGANLDKHQLTRGNRRCRTCRNAQYHARRARSIKLRAMA